MGESVEKREREREREREVRVWERGEEKHTSGVLVS
jgi:hypothetical protein